MCRHFGTSCFIYTGGVRRKSKLDEMSREFTEVKVGTGNFEAAGRITGTRLLGYL
jgi:hypothetical protein